VFNKPVKEAQQFYDNCGSGHYIRSELCAVRRKFDSLHATLKHSAMLKGNPFISLSLRICVAGGI